ncbi:MAG: non-homologous end-joining DNA ligase, partial [Myxococcales bacterium]|nr:non-homologous end-joining DNA ligase [Myxococcales bacterium]
EGRSPDWKKVRIERADDFAIVGFNETDKPGRPGFRGLHLARGAGRDLVYAGRVGSGFTQDDLRAIRAQLDPLVRPTQAFIGEVPKSGREEIWVEPELVCEVRYLLKTEDGHLRNPVFVRMRDDKSVEDLLEPEPEHFESDPKPQAGLPDHGRDVPFTNLDKVYWPEDGYTKGDLVEFYRQVAPALLPYLADRPLVLTRYPDGIHGKNFFQKDAPPFIPGWLRTERMWSELARREIDYIVADNLETLLYVANLGSIPLHVWSSRISNLQRPDWCVLDLDPKGAPFAHVVRLARAIHELCDEIGLASVPKTSGSTGMHVLIPLGGQYTFEQSRILAELMSRVVASEHPDIATLERALDSRAGRVYFDYLQNGHGRILAAPYCVRPLPGAPVSTPLEWSEVDESLDPTAFTIRTVPARLAAAKRDLLQPLLTERADLAAVLERLAPRVHRS